MKKLGLFTLLICWIFIYSCVPEKQTQVVILSVVDESGEEITDFVTIIVEGEEKDWIPGDILEFDISMDVNHGFVQVIGEIEDYRMLSPMEYEIEKGKGLELVLTFTRVEELLVIDEPEEEVVEEEVEPQMVQARFNVTPSETEVRVQSRTSATNRRTFTGSTTLELLEGSYTWTATYEGYDDLTGNVTIRPGQTNVIGISLEETPPEDGYLTIFIQPREAEIILRNRESDVEYIFSAAELEQKAVRPGLYDYTVNAPGYRTIDGNIRIRESESRELYETLANISSSELLSSARSVNTIGDASNFYANFRSMNGIPPMSTEARDEFVRLSTDIAMMLFEGGEAASGREFFEELYRAEPDNVQLRMYFGSILMRDGQYSRSREVLRDIFGQLQNIIPVTYRSEIVFEARFRYATSYFLEFINIPEHDFDRRETVGDRALREFEDVIAIFDSSPALQSSSTMQDLAEQSADRYNSIFRDLGYN